MMQNIISSASPSGWLFFFLLPHRETLQFYLVFALLPAHGSISDRKAQPLNRALLMPATLAQGCQGADGMWSGEAKLAHCDSDNQVLYFWLCFEVYVLLLPISEVGVQTHSTLPWPAASAQNCVEEAAAWRRASATDEEPARGLGWQYPKEQTFLWVLLQNFLPLQWWGALGPVQGSCSIPPGSSPTAFAFAFSQQLLPQKVIPSVSSWRLVKCLWWMGSEEDLPSNMLLGNLSSNLLTTENCTTSAKF